VYALTTPTALDSEVREQMLEHRAIMGLSGADEYHQRPAAAIYEVMDLAGQPATGTANTVVRRFDEQTRVIRPSPLCRG
jgi:hypothetical protein